MTEKTTKTYKRAAFGIFTETQKILGLPPGKLCEALGYAGNAHHKWEEAGQMPAVAALACEALQRRQRKAGGDGQEILVRVVFDKSGQMIEAKPVMVGSLSRIEINAQPYHLLPAKPAAAK